MNNSKCSSSSRHHSCNTCCGSRARRSLFSSQGSRNAPSSLTTAIWAVMSLRTSSLSNSSSTRCSPSEARARPQPQEFKIRRRASTRAGLAYSRLPTSRVDNPKSQRLQSKLDCTTTLDNSSTLPWAKTPTITLKTTSRWSFV